jgi:splicing factor 3B subunit 3
LLVAKASGVLELYQIATESIVLKLVQRLYTHCLLRSIVCVRLTGEKRDLCAVASDSGAFSLLDVSTPNAKPNIVTFGKMTCRRLTPGQYIVADPKGRAVMIGALEKQKLVYVLNHASGKTTIVSPLEAHCSRSITFAMTGVDNSYDNPVFACLELQYPEEDDDLYTKTHHQNSNNVTTATQKQLANNELDLGLNHVSRKWATNVHSKSCSSSFIVQTQQTTAAHQEMSRIFKEVEAEPVGFALVPGSGVPYACWHIHLVTSSGVNGASSSRVN